MAGVLRISTFNRRSMLLRAGHASNGFWRNTMAKVGKDQDFDSFFSKVGADSTSTFDNAVDDSTEFANSEATNAATFVAGDGESALEEEDDDAAELEEDDEEDEMEDVEDEAGV
jgi:hypothetical protein